MLPSCIALSLVIFKTALWSTPRGRRVQWTGAVSQSAACYLVSVRPVAHPPSPRRLGLGLTRSPAILGNPSCRIPCKHPEDFSSSNCSISTNGSFFWDITALEDARSTYHNTSVGPESSTIASPELESSFIELEYQPTRPTIY